MASRPAIADLLMLLMTVIWAAPAHAGWPLLTEASTLRFLSVKQDHLAEVHRFERVEGRLFDSGRATVRVDLASVDTGIGIRDRRMARQLFAADRHPTARLQTRVGLAALRDLAPGKAVRRELEARLRLHGRTRTVRAEVVVTKRAEGGFRVTSLAPVVLDVRDYGLAPGVAILRRLAGLDRISYAVPVTFSLVFADPS
jgi:hypothetical protein